MACQQERSCSRRCSRLHLSPAAAGLVQASHCRARAKRTRTDLSSAVTQRAEGILSAICPRLGKGTQGWPTLPRSVCLLQMCSPAHSACCSWFWSHHIKELVGYICWLTKELRVLTGRTLFPSTEDGTEDSPLRAPARARIPKYL